MLFIHCVYKLDYTRKYILWAKWFLFLLLRSFFIRLFSFWYSCAWFNFIRVWNFISFVANFVFESKKKLYLPKFRIRKKGNWQYASLCDRQPSIDTCSISIACYRIILVWVHAALVSLYWNDFVEWHETVRFSHCERVRDLCIDLKSSCRYHEYHS